MHLVKQVVVACAPVTSKTAVFSKFSLNPQPSKGNPMRLEEPAYRDASSAEGGTNSPYVEETGVPDDADGAIH